MKCPECEFNNFAHMNYRADAMLFYDNDSKIPFSNKALKRSMGFYYCDVCRYVEWSLDEVKNEQSS